MSADIGQNAPVERSMESINNHGTELDKKRSLQTNFSENEPKSNPAKRTKIPRIVKRKYKNKEVEPTSPMGVLKYEIMEILAEKNLQEEHIKNDMSSILNTPDLINTYHRVVNNVEILKMSSHGDGIALIPHPERMDGNQIILVPFTFPGDIVNVKVFKTHPLYAESDLISIEKPGKYRDDSLIKCRYFGKCSGCQYQNLTYANQLLFKKNTIRNAYKYFAPKLFTKDQNSGKALIPEISETEPSPLTYSYRTKLTPHFDLPKKLPPLESRTKPSLGFGSKNKNQWRPTDGGDYSILDIEECIIGTDIINKGMENERNRFDANFMNYKKGATILLRENTKLVKNIAEVDEGSRDANQDISKVVIEVEKENEADSTKIVKTCVTNQRQIVQEHINGFIFEFSAGEFFQNNNSILPIVTSYVESNLKIDDDVSQPNYLVDAYCGSGLFSITCSKGVSKVIGVEVSGDSVKFAQRNAKLNNVENTHFIHGKAEEIFAEIDTPAERTSVILDPPRKGCDEVFLNQLSDFNPAKIVYISCNVHSQARDIEWFVKNTKNGPQYKIESIKGFDFFPQTHHVESVAVLSLK